MTSREFEIHFRRLYAPLGMYALRLIGNVDDAEDVVQESFAKVWTLVNSGCGIDNFRAYMYRTVHNEAMHRLRQSACESIDLSDYGEVTEEVIDTSERDAALWHAIDKLSPRCREAFLLSKRDGMTNVEIADELGISVKTVENQITKAYSALRQTLTGRSGKIFFLPFF